MNVYFIVAKNQTKRLLKIGKAKDVDKRLSQIQTGCPYRVGVYSTIKCKDDQQAFAVERAAHELFRKKRTRSNGEWFRFTKDVQESVDRFCDIARERELVEATVVVERKGRHSRLNLSTRSDYKS